MVVTVVVMKMVATVKIITVVMVKVKIRAVVLQ